MKTHHALFLAFGLFTAFASAAQAEDVNVAGFEACSGSERVDGEWITGSCRNGTCSAWTRSLSLRLRSRCISGTEVEGTGRSQPEYLTGDCRSGSIALWDRGLNISLNGSCGENGRFRATLRTNAQYISGTCQPNGSFSIYVGSRYGYWTGDCTTP